MSENATRQHYKLATGQPLQSSPPPSTPRVADRNRGGKSAGGAVYKKGGKAGK